MALPCNILVVTLGSYFAVSRRDFDWRMAVPFFLSSVPMAFLGGIVPVDASIYFLLLGLSLSLAGVSLCVRRAPDGSVVSERSWALATCVGGSLGLLSGMVGIGGGIFLAPILHHLRWASSKTIAALCSFFILINSISGLAGQLLKTGVDQAIMQLTYGLPLFAAVVLGGVIGARFCNRGRSASAGCSAYGAACTRSGYKDFVGVDILYTRVTEKISCSLTRRPVN